MSFERKGIMARLVRATLILFVISALFTTSCRVTSSEGKTYLVRDVIDGDTIELAGGKRVRYLGIDTPETTRRVGDQWLYYPEPYAQEAKDLNRSLVLNQMVRLERTPSSAVAAIPSNF